MNPDLCRRLCLDCGVITDFKRIPGRVSLLGAHCSGCGSKQTSNLPKELLHCPACQSDAFTVTMTHPRKFRTIAQMSCRACNYQKTTAEALSVLSALESLMNIVLAAERVQALHARAAKRIRR